MISDGECAEGSIWESLAFIHKQNLTNLKVYVNINGMGAYEYIDVDYLTDRLKSFLPFINIVISEPLDLGFTKGLESHYHVIKPEEYDTL